jgi:hypothetical protein
MDMRLRSSANITMKKRKLRPVTFTCARCLSKITFSRAPALVLPPCLAEARREYQRELIRKGRSRQKAIANFFGGCCGEVCRNCIQQDHHSSGEEEVLVDRYWLQE